MKKIILILLVTLLTTACSTIIETTKFQECRWDISEQNYLETDQIYIHKSKFKIKKQEIIFTSADKSTSFKINEVIKTTDSSDEKIVIYDCVHNNLDIRLTYYTESDFMLIFGDKAGERYQTLIIFGN